MCNCCNSVNYGNKIFLDNNIRQFGNWRINLIDISISRTNQHLSSFKFDVNEELLKFKVTFVCRNSEKTICLNFVSALPSHLWYLSGFQPWPRGLDLEARDAGVDCRGGGRGHARQAGPQSQSGGDRPGDCQCDSVWRWVLHLRAGHGWSDTSGCLSQSSDTR